MATDSSAPPGRPEILWPLFAELSSLPGVGEKTAKLFLKLGAARPRDLIFTPPHGVIDRRIRPSIAGAPLDEVATVEALIGEHHPPRVKGRPYRVMAEDEGASFVLVFFHAREDWLRRELPEGRKRVVSGKIEIFDGVMQMTHPDYILTRAEAEALPPFEAVYPLTAGLGRRQMAKAVAAALALAPDPPEWLDKALMAREKWPGWRAALTELHAPESRASLSSSAPARRRLAYDELLAHALTLALARARMRRGRGRASVGDGARRARLLKALPFPLTGAQRRAAAEIEADMGAPERMLRLLQGDVGAGKTLVAMLALLIAVEAGGQGALMVPTEILARQHFANLAPLAEAAGVRVDILTGRDKSAARAEKLAALAAAETDILIGTHALFQKGVEFADLRLVVIDEQHRFGVRQRMELIGKGGGADVLSMTATPIPRTLALASHGDMDISVLDEKPPGRRPIDTRIVPDSRVGDVVARLRAALAEGRRAYWVCPLVEESETSDMVAAEMRARALRQALGAERVALVHGQMPPAEKDAAMAAFQSGAAQVLVATTVIEVGVDVPEATIMVIEQAERFGLAQLHQLRGRVGRGESASTCLLLYRGPLGEAARARLTVLRETEDGFRIAEEDLKLRGAGDLLGAAQSGLPQFRIADLETSGDLMRIAQVDARLILEREPELDGARGPALRILLYLHERDAAIRYLRGA
ncbi:ATP-dependent DNA helicase RecG [Pikeienuella sp. HZG-20]|uniref:ATP-dependent DNA helicase RecG n=1 Tax=Paludibacillus litoralis TaxID=3133267 RepID=UPI0030EF8453